jgi:pyruvate kinase
MSPSSRTQIVVTVGPSCSREADIEQLVAAGADVVRLNFSHGTHEEHAGFIAMVRSVGERLGHHIPIVQDLSGPRGKTEEGHAFDDDKEILTEKDLNDLDFGIAQRVDYVAQSYVGSVADVQRLRAEIVARGASIPIIAKIERDEAVHDIDAIIATADAIMVARGDLGLAEPLGEIPFIERTIIEKCKAAKKPVIVATQMLYSMVENAEPTRAEVTDEVFAIITGADAVMLSDETARGKHPLEAVQAMEKIAVRAEESAEVPSQRNLL